MKHSIADKVLIRGAPVIYAVPAVVDGQPVVDPSDSRWESARREVLAGSNVVCAGMYVALQHIMAREIDDWQAATIDLGFGGDYDQPADPGSTPPSDQGERIPATFSDTYMRKPLFSAAVKLAKSSAVTSAYRWIYSATVHFTEAVTDSNDPEKPFINEFGLMAANGTMLAHFIPSAANDGTTVQRAKSSLEWWVIQWVFEFVGTETTE